MSRPIFANEREQIDFMYEQNQRLVARVRELKEENESLNEQLEYYKGSKGGSKSIEEAEKEVGFKLMND